MLLRIVDGNRPPPQTHNHQSNNLTRFEKLQVRFVQGLVVDEHLSTGQLGRVSGHLLRTRLHVELRLPGQERLNGDFRALEFSLKTEACYESCRVWGSLNKVLN